MRRIKHDFSPDFAQGMLWIVVACVGYALTYSFDSEIANYRYGAASWPRVILLMLGFLGFGQVVFAGLRWHQQDRASAPPV